MNERGFSLTELLVACAIIGMVMAGIFTLQQQGQQAYLFGSGRVEVQQNARLALDLMTRELRSAQSITSCSATGIGLTDSGGTAASYARSGAAAPYTLTRTYSGTTSDVIGGVQSITITCYNTDGYTATTTAAEVRSVRIQIQTRITESVGSGAPRDQHAFVESRVKLRNL